LRGRRLNGLSPNHPPRLVLADSQFLPYLTIDVGYGPPLLSADSLTQHYNAMIMIRTPLDDPATLKKFNYYARLKKLLSYMKTNISERLKLEDAAQVACMEKTAFSKFFSRTVGITFHDFVQQWRVASAVDQMLATDNSLTQIAFATGFQSMITFERAFKKRTGMTPSEFRRNLLCAEGIPKAKI